jgi:hypothetical protein
MTRLMVSVVNDTAIMKSEWNIDGDRCLLNGFIDPGSLNLFCFCVCRVILGLKVRTTPIISAMCASSPWCWSHAHLWNVGILLPDYTAQQPRRQSSSHSPPWEPEVSRRFLAYLTMLFPLNRLVPTWRRMVVIVWMIHCQDMKRSGHGLFGTVPEFAWKDWGKFTVTIIESPGCDSHPEPLEYGSWVLC